MLGERPSLNGLQTGLQACSFGSHFQPPKHPGIHILAFRNSWARSSSTIVNSTDQILFFWTSLAELRVTRRPDSTRINTISDDVTTLNNKRIGRYRVKPPWRLDTFASTPVCRNFELQVSWRKKQLAKLTFIVVGTCLIPSPTTVDWEGKPSGSPTRKYSLLLAEKLSFQSLEVYSRIETCADVLIRECIAFI